MEGATKPSAASMARSISPEGKFVTSFPPTWKGRPEPISMQSVASSESRTMFSSPPVSPTDPAFTLSSPRSPTFLLSDKSASIGHMSMASFSSYGSSSTFSDLGKLEKGDLDAPVARPVFWGEPKKPLPEKRQARLLRHARHTFLNVYRRLFSLVFLFNMAGLGALLSQNHNWMTAPPLEHFATAAAANIMVAVLIRQDYIVNLLYKMTWLVPLSAPLKLRCIFGKVYELGGVHSGCAVSSLIWFALLSGFLFKQFAINALVDIPLLVFTSILLSLLLSLVITAYPTIRAMTHNTFEYVHRWAGWFSLALFWGEIVLFANTQVQPSSPSLGLLCIKLPAFWFLFISSLHAILPWLRFHKMAVFPEHLSSHAIRLHFKEPIDLFVGMRLSDSPLKEWHSFACIPTRDGGKTGGSVLISNAGDWTRKTINNPQPYYWVKGVPTTGVLCMARIFRSIIIVTTGSGIGPCLGVMQDIPKTSVRVIWSTPNPLQTYGAGILEAVRETDKQAIIWDTKKQGRPDLVKLAWNLWTEERAEAIFVISNPKLTRKVVYGMESRGVPAFGPIWDS